MDRQGMITFLQVQDNQFIVVLDGSKKESFQRASTAKNYNAMFSLVLAAYINKVPVKFWVVESKVIKLNDGSERFEIDKVQYDP